MIETLQSGGETPLVSVIVPVYNGAAYLGDALESARRQTYRPLEVIVVDDGSTDASAEVASGFPEVRCVSQPHQGISAARNRAIELAQGELLALLDADDLWLPDKLELQVQALRSNPELDFVFGHVQEFASPELPAEVQGQLHCEEGLRPGPIPSTLLIRREAFFRVGWFEPDLQVAEFASWLLRANEAGLRRAMLPHLVARRRLHTANHGIRQRQQFNAYARILKASLDRRRAAGKPGEG